MNVDEGPDTDLAVGIDVGGTNLRVALVGQHGCFSTPITEPVSVDRTAFIIRIQDILRTLDPTASRSVGIGLPGRVDPHNNSAVSAGYIDIAGLSAAEMFGAGHKRLVRLDNDAAMALRAEMAIGVARGVSDVVMLTIGTGIGGAYALDGKVVHGRAFAGQFGHLTVDGSSGECCNCGRVGCIETTSSGTALGRLVRSAGLPPKTRAAELIGAAAQGEPKSLAVVRQWAQPLRCALESIAAMLDPDLIVLGGGLGREALAALDYAPARSTWFSSLIGAASLGDNAGVIGAGLYALGSRPAAAQKQAS